MNKNYEEINFKERDKNIKNHLLEEQKEKRVGSVLDLKSILQNKETIEKNCQQRNVKIDLDLIEKSAEQRLQTLKKVEQSRAELNKISALIKSGTSESEREKLIEDGQNLKRDLKEKEDDLGRIELTLKENTYKIPNFTSPDAPIGFTDQENVEIKKIGEIREFDFPVKDHVEIGKSLDILDFEKGSETTGSKFCFLKNEGALLDLALTQYAFEILTKEGFQLFITPDLARLEVIEGTGYNPRGPETQIYKIENENLGLIATAEITLAGLLRNKTINEKDLPLKLAGLSHCFRKEAGAYGKASKGLYRVHQFTKIEMFIFSLPEDSEKILEYLVDTEIKIFQGLGIPLRVVDCCTGDLGTSAYRKFDLEAWMPKEKKWGEITSASNCTDYQARRLNIKIKRKNLKTEFIHTLNATGLATSRALLSILENYQQADGSVLIPQSLRKWIDKERIVPKK